MEGSLVVRVAKKVGSRKVKGAHYVHSVPVHPSLLAMQFSFIRFCYVYCVTLMPKYIILHQ